MTESRNQIAYLNLRWSGTDLDLPISVSTGCSPPMTSSIASIRRRSDVTSLERRYWMKNFGHADTFKRQYAEQEFNAIKRRCTGQQLIQKSTCIIAVKRDEPNVKRTVLSSVVGTLDINIRHLQCGETFPGEHMRNPFSCGIFGRKDKHLYGYVANLSVAKYARRRGIAINMLLLAVEVATSYGVNEVFVHVYKDNMVAQKLYEKLGFKMVEKAASQSLEEQTYLLCLKPAQLATLYDADT